MLKNLCTAVCQRETKVLVKENVFKKESEIICSRLSQTDIEFGEHGTEDG